MDRRLVKTAVIGHARSAEPAFMPTEPDKAEAFRDRSQERQETFWCGHLLGGCGGRLSLKIVRERETVPHFAHWADSNECARLRKGGEGTRGGRSADHLYAHRHLRTWMRDQEGTSAAVEATPRFEGLAPGRACTELIVPTGGKDLRLVFTHDLDHELLDQAKSPAAHEFVWLVRANDSITRALVANGVPYWRFRLADDAHHRRALQVGIRDGSGEIEWMPLAECVLRGDHLRRFRPALGEPRAQARQEVATAPAPDPLEQAMASLRRVLEQRDEANVRALAEVLRRRLTQQGASGLPRDLVTDARALLREAAQALPPPPKTITAPRRVPVVAPYRRTNRPQDPIRDVVDRHIGKLVWAEQKRLSRAYEDNRAALVDLLNRPDTPKDLMDRIKQQLRASPKDRFSRTAPTSQGRQRRSPQGGKAEGGRRPRPSGREARQHAQLRECLQTLRWAQERKMADTYAHTRAQLVQALERPDIPQGLREQIKAQLLRSPQGLFDRPMPVPGPPPTPARPRQGKGERRQGRGHERRDAKRKAGPAPSAQGEGGLLSNARMDERSRRLLEQMRDRSTGDG